MALVLKAGGIKKNKKMSPEIKQLCERENIKKFEEAVQEESKVLISLSKKYFWNSLITVGFFSYFILYVLFSAQPQKVIIAISILTVLLASFERIYIQRKIKSKVTKLATFSAIIQFLKNINTKNESISNR